MGGGEEKENVSKKNSAMHVKNNFLNKNADLDPTHLEKWDPDYSF